MEYLVDYATPETRAAGRQMIRQELERMAEGPLKKELVDRLRRIAESGARDLYF